MQIASHFTDLRHAWSMQVPQDLPRNPNKVFGGVIIVDRDYGLPEMPPIIPRHMHPIMQKRNTDDLEKIRQMLSGLLKRPAGQTPNAGAGGPRPK